MTSLLRSCHIQHVCWHYKSVYFIVTCHDNDQQSYQRLTHTSERARFGHFAHIMWTGWSHLIWHNCVKISDNWTKICNLAKIGTFNRCVKNRLQILNCLWNNEKNVRSPGGGGFFFDSHCTCISLCRLDEWDMCWTWRQTLFDIDARSSMNSQMPARKTTDTPISIAGGRSTKILLIY